MLKNRSWRLAGPALIPRVCEGIGEPGLVSVLIPTFNRASLLQACIDSVLAQTYPKVEIIVVDDGSTDDTRAVAASFGDRIVYIFQENAGLATARNTGLVAARGEFVAFQDSDDIWMPWKLEAQVGIMQRVPELALVWTDMTAVDPSGSVLHRTYLSTSLSVYRSTNVGNWLKVVGTVASLLSVCAPEIAGADVLIGDIFTPMFLGNLVHPPVALMRRAHVHRAGGLDVAMTWTCEDYEFFWRVAKEGPGALIEAPSMLYRVEATDQLTKPDLIVFVARGNLVAMNRRLEEDAARIGLKKPEIHSRLARAHGWLAEEELFSPYGNRLAAIRSFIISLRYNPWHKRRIALLAASLLLPSVAITRIRGARKGLIERLAAKFRKPH